jgi:ATP-dependent DNA ligase
MQYIYPPRPKSRIPPGNLPTYEKFRIWVAQLKFNGTRTVIQITPSGNVNFFNRHHAEHRRFTPSQDIIDQVLNLDLEKGKEHWLDGELIKNRTKDLRYKDKIILFDVLMLDGKYLFGKPTQLIRLGLLQKICRFPKKLEPGYGIALSVSDNIWMAEYWENDFVKHFEAFITCPEIEGLVLRKKTSVIDNVGTAEYEVSWLLRCRKPDTNYEF